MAMAMAMAMVVIMKVKALQNNLTESVCDAV